MDGEVEEQCHTLLILVLHGAEFGFTPRLHYLLF
jgi:hypothetical protein